MVLTNMTRHSGDQQPNQEHLSRVPRIRVLHDVGEFSVEEIETPRLPE